MVAADSLGATVCAWASLADVFLSARAEYSDRPALWVGGSFFTYQELHDRAMRLAAAICAEENVTIAGRQCGLLVNRTPTAYASVIASLLSGRTYVPLNPRFPAERLRAVLDASACDTLVVDERSIDAIQPLLETAPRLLRIIFADTDVPEWAARFPSHIFVGKDEVARTPPFLSRASVSQETDGAYLLFTSGSTGAPKGILISHRNVLTYLRNVLSRYAPTPDDRFSQLFDFSFDLSVHDMFLCWAAGACLCCAPEGNILGLDDFIRRLGITYWFSVPSVAAFMAKLRALKPGRYPTLRVSLFCGEALPMSLARKWQSAAPNAVLDNLYGPTEATVAFTAFRLQPSNQLQTDELDVVPIGTPFPNQRFAIIDEAGDELPDGEAGELCLGGAQVAQGYWQASELTGARFRGPNQADPDIRWYRTGDRAIRTHEHGLLFLGRVDRQVKILGHRVELSEVEAALRSAAGAEMAAAVAWPVSNDGLATGIVGFLPSLQSEAETISACRRTLPTYMVPNKIVWLADWPLNVNGKTDYKRLLVMLEASHGERN